MRYRRSNWAFVLAGLLTLGLIAGGCTAKKAADSPGAPGTVQSIRTGTGVEMVLIPAGQFIMGSLSGDEDEQPPHAVRLGAFYMDRTEVAQKSFESLLGINPSKFKGSDRPVERASWLAAARYCNVRSIKEGLTPCYDLQTQKCNFQADGYRLPTEAEWEYACRAGTAGEYPFGPDAAALADHAWFKANAGQATHPVGQKQPNRWGLFDMLGNVAEWCNDFYDAQAYAADAPAAGAHTGQMAAEPHGPESSNYRVLRGGSWRTGQGQCRSAARMGESPGYADTCLGYEAYGFRCVRKA